MAYSSHKQLEEAHNQVAAAMSAAQDARQKAELLDAEKTGLAARAAELEQEALQAHGELQHLQLEAAQERAAAASQAAAAAAAAAAEKQMLLEEVELKAAHLRELEVQHRNTQVQEERECGRQGSQHSNTCLYWR